MRVASRPPQFLQGLGEGSMMAVVGQQRSRLESGPTKKSSYMLVKLSVCSKELSPSSNH